MIHYHGGPITPVSAALACWTGRHAFISFAYPDQVAVAAEVCQSFALDNGAFSAWRNGRATDWPAYYRWCESWLRHPACDWAVIPDVIDGDEAANDALVQAWPLGPQGVPVWHLHERIARLEQLMRRWSRVALGSSGQYAAVGTAAWRARMDLVMRAVCDAHGRPQCKLHGLRMLDPAVFGGYPLASADSTNVARNVGIDSRWRGMYSDSSKEVRAQVLAQRIEALQAPPVYEFHPQQALPEVPCAPQ